MTISEVPMKDIYGINVKFGFNNQTQQLVAAGLYSNKNFYKAVGYFFLNKKSHI